jgi:predicted GNAT family acetyltransferase
MEDDVLIATVRDQLREEGLDEETIEAQIEDMRDAGFFVIPDSAW